LSAENIVVSRFGVQQGGELAVCDIVDMHDIKTRVDKPGMRPDAASMTIRPVGVGLWSRGPIGAVGCTIMAGKSCEVIVPRRFAGSDLALLIGSDRTSFALLHRFVS
jgi:hypothetical protein